MIEESKIQRIRGVFFEHLTHFEDLYSLDSHIIEMEKWAKITYRNNPNADLSVILLSVYLHDIGHYPINDEEDHAVSGEMIARNILEKEGFDKEIIEKVAHCIRAHRCKDVMPETIEAKIVAFIDSVSHATDNNMYLGMAKADTRLSVEQMLNKIDRDLRDLKSFQKDVNMEERAESIENICSAWKVIVTEYRKLNMN